MRKRDLIRQHYEPRVHRDRESYDILDWASRESQQARFGVLLRVLQRIAAGTLGVPGPRPLRLLDVGCGLADLRLFLESRHVPVSYTGVDLVAVVLREAKRRQRHAELLVADMFDAAPFRPGAFDVVFASGIFNLNLGNNAAFIRRAVPQLVSLARTCAVTNFLHVRTPQHYPHCVYFDPRQLAVDFAGYCQRVETVDDYLENDFTLVLCL